jgi:hypothetical protein
MAATQVSKEAMWLKKLMHALRIWRGPIQILCDNQGAIKLSKHHIEHARSKHIDVQWHFLRDKLQRETLQLSIATQRRIWQTA